jgi:hypothetical protein
MGDSDRYVDLIDELELDRSKLGGHPLWQGKPMDIAAIMGGGTWRLHHRITGDLVAFDEELGDGAVIYVFLEEGNERGAICWQVSGGGKERTYSHFIDTRRRHLEEDDRGGFLL